MMKQAMISNNNNNNNNNTKIEMYLPPLAAAWISALWPVAVHGVAGVSRELQRVMRCNNSHNNNNNNYYYYYYYYYYKTNY